MDEKIDKRKLKREQKSGHKKRKQRWKKNKENVGKSTTQNDFLVTFLERQSGEEAKNAIKSEQKNETNNAKKKGDKKWWEKPSQMG